MKEDIFKSHLKKKSQSKLALSISLFIVLLTSTGYIFNLMSVLIMIKYQTFLTKSGLINCREIQNKKYRIEKLLL